MIFIVEQFRMIYHLEQPVEGDEKLVGVQGGLRLVVAEPQFLVDLEASHPREIIGLRLEIEPLQIVGHDGGRDVIGGLELAVDELQGLLGAVRLVLFQALLHVMIEQMEPFRLGFDYLRDGL